MPHPAYDPWFRSSSRFETHLRHLGILGHRFDYGEEVEDYDNYDEVGDCAPPRRRINGRRDYSPAPEHTYPHEMDYLDEEEIEARDLVCVADLANIYRIAPSLIMEKAVLKDSFPPLQGYTEGRIYHDQWYDRIDCYEWVEIHRTTWKRAW